MMQFMKFSPSLWQHYKWMEKMSCESAYGHVAFFLFLSCYTSEEKYGCVTTALLVVVGLKHS
jgi:hypothetical protein